MALGQNENHENHRFWSVLVYFSFNQTRFFLGTRYFGPIAIAIAIDRVFGSSLAVLRPLAGPASSIFRPCN